MLFLNILLELSVNGNETTLFFFILLFVNILKKFKKKLYIIPILFNFIVCDAVDPSCINFGLIIIFFILQLLFLFFFFCKTL